MQRIIVAGLLPVQNQKIAQRYGRRVDIRFLTTDTSVNGWAKAANGDYEKVFMTTKFISHKHQDAIPREKIIYVNGSLSAMCRELEKHFPLTGMPATTLADLPSLVKEHSSPTVNIMRDFAARNGLLEKEPPVTEPSTGLPVAHQVYNLLSHRAVGSRLTPKEATKLLGFDDKLMPNVNTAMAKASTKGYLARPAKGIYEITEKTANIDQLKGSRKTRQTRGPGAPIKVPKDPIAWLEQVSLALTQTIEALKNAPKFDITSVTNKELYSEVARRNTK